MNIPPVRALDVVLVVAVGVMVKMVVVVVAVVVMVVGVVVKMVVAGSVAPQASPAGPSTTINYTASIILLHKEVIAPPYKPSPDNSEPVALVLSDILGRFIRMRPESEALSGPSGLWHIPGAREKEHT